MKTPKFRVWITGLAVSCMALGGGYEETKAPAEVRTDVPLTEEPLLQVDAEPLDLANVDADVEAAPPASSVTSTNAAGTNAIKMVQAPVVPEEVSPALQEIIKLVQAGLSEEVIMSYITNSTNAFSVDADDLVYLNDLGVSSAVVTAIIQQDNTADARAKKHSIVAVKPLPAGTALTKPATNVYKQGLYAAPSESIPMGDLPPAYEETEAATTYAPPEGEQQPVTVNQFYNTLAPYGSWVDVPDYGLCWRPTVAVTDSSWRPYSNNGRWLWTDQGWYWYSDYSWGWAPFHYGRWASYPGYGWVWAPDTHWGPAWVTWRSSRSYYGWAPLPPRCHYVDGFGLYYRNSSVSISFGFGLGSDCYTFIPINRFCDRRPGLYYSNHRDGRRIFKDSVVINNYVSGKNNTVINRGIGVDRVAQANRGEVPRAQIRRTELASNRGSRAERIENDGNTPVVVAPSVPRTSVNAVGRPNRNGNKAVEPAGNSVTPRPVSTVAGAGNVANSLAPNRPANGRNSARANVNNDNQTPVGRGNAAALRNNDAQVVRSRPQQPRGNGNVTIAGATPVPSAPSAGNAVGAQSQANRPNQAAQNNRPSSVSGSRLIAGNNRPDNAQPRNNAAPIARPNTAAQSGIIRGFSPQSQNSAASVPRSQPVVPGRVFGGGNQNRPQAVAPRSQQSPSVIHIPRPAQGQSYSPAYRQQSAPNVSSIPRSAPSSAPRSIAPSAPSAPRAAMSAPSGGGGNRGGGGGGNANRGGGGGNGGGNRGGNGGGGGNRANR
jgi:hypothetical protein